MMTTNSRCPKCGISFCPVIARIPLVLPCRHSLCRGCLPSTQECPVIPCLAPIVPTQEFPVNHTLLGQVMMEQLEKQEETVTHNDGRDAKVPKNASKSKKAKVEKVPDEEPTEEEGEEDEEEYEVESIVDKKVVKGGR